MNRIPQSLNCLTLSDTNLESITTISLNLDSPEYNLHNSVPIYPIPPVITIFFHEIDVLNPTLISEPFAKMYDSGF